MPYKYREYRKKLAEKAEKQTDSKIEQKEQTDKVKQNKRPSKKGD